MGKNKIMLEKLLSYLRIPLLALYSKSFYLSLLGRRGVGFTYLLCLSLVLAFPATYFKVYDMMQLFKSLQISTYVARIPASYLNGSGVLAPNNPDDSFVVISNPQGDPVMVYNTDDQPLEGELRAVPIELRSRFLIIRSSDPAQEVQLAWDTIYPVNQSFEPYEAASVLDQALNASFMYVWVIVALYLFCSLALGTLITAAFAMLICLLIFRLGLRYTHCLRLMAYAHTMVALILLLQFFILIPISFTFMLLIPLVYVFMFGSALRAFALREVEAAIKKSKAREEQKKFYTGEAGAGSAAGSDASASSSASSSTEAERGPEAQHGAEARPQDHGDRGRRSNDGNGSGGTFVA